MQTLRRLDTNSDKWFKSEQDQMRRIHRAYQNAMQDASAWGSSNSLYYQPASTPAIQSTDTVSVATTTVKEGEQPQPKPNDSERYLPKDSVLRSDKGEMKRPGNCPFKDFDTFLKTLDFEYWKQNFNEDGHDPTLSSTAKGIVAHICIAQANQLRVRHGSKPLGRYWRAKREHITPLALVMHELKLWATNHLRVANAMEESTQLEIAKRMKYIQSLQRKEIWGASKGLLQQGMRPIAHDKLFRLLLETREELVRAKEYAFRRYCGRRSREKLERLERLLKTVFMDECELLSLLASFDGVVTEPGTPRLHPTDLLNQLHNQTFVDYHDNFVNVCLRRMFQLPLVKRTLLSDFSSEMNEDAALMETIQNWSDQNLFCVKSVDETAASLLRINNETGLPQVYCDTWASLGEELKQADKKLKVPQKPAYLASHIKEKVFSQSTDATLVLDGLALALATLQDIIPCMYAVHELWEIAGEGGDFTLYDTLRRDVIHMMGNMVARVYALHTAERRLLNVMASLAQVQQETMETRRIKTKKSETEPNWTQNLRYVELEILPNVRKKCLDVLIQAQEIARDGWDYALTKSKFDERIDRTRRLGQVLAGEISPAIFQGEFSMEKIVDIKKKDWIGSLGISSRDAYLDLPSPLAALSDTATFRAQQEALDKEEKQIALENQEADEQSSKRRSSALNWPTNKPVATSPQPALSGNEKPFVSTNPFA